MGDTINQCISIATSCLYGLSEIAVLATDYAPSIDFTHWGKHLTFFYDIADIIKLDGLRLVSFLPEEKG